MSLDVFELCTADLQQRLTPSRERFKAEEDKRVDAAEAVKSLMYFAQSDSFAEGNWVCCVMPWFVACDSIYLYAIARLSVHHTGVSYKKIVEVGILKFLPYGRYL